MKKRPTETTLESVPVPDTRRALLFNEQLRRWTWHAYRRTERSKFVLAQPDIPNPRTRTTPCWAFIFQCVDSGVERKWGVQ